jgi:hypothetical protein
MPTWNSWYMFVRELLVSHDCILRSTNTQDHLWSCNHSSHKIMQKSCYFRGRWRTYLGRSLIVTTCSPAAGNSPTRLRLRPYALGGIFPGRDGSFGVYFRTHVSEDLPEIAQFVSSTWRAWQSRKAWCTWLQRNKIRSLVNGNWGCGKHLSPSAQRPQAACRSSYHLGKRSEKGNPKTLPIVSRDSFQGNELWTTPVYSGWMQLPKA